MSQEKKSRSERYNTEVIKIDDISEEVEEHHTPFLKKIIIYLILIIISILAYSSLIATQLIDVKEYKIENNRLPESFDGFKIVHFSDIHYGNTINKKQLDKIVNKINNLKPDIIIFTGDLISKDIVINDEIRNEIKTSLNKLECSLYKYAIYGDEDTEEYKDIMEQTNFILLDNSSKLLYYKGNEPIAISGLNIKDKQNYSILNSPVDDTDIIGFYHIVLIHEPDTIDNFLTYRPNLVLAGHTLGGTIHIPPLKPMFLPNNGTKYYEDHYSIDNINENTELYISNGLGTNSISARFNNRPSINLYRIYKKESTY